jgi:DNA primase
MAFYGDEIIERVRDASDIVEVVASYLPLKRKGRNWWGKCPFHQEKTPSFSVSPDKQIFHCFGCHKGGNVFSFVMEYEKVAFPDALKLLAAKANIALPERTIKRDSKELDQLYYAHEVAAAFFAENLRDSRKTLEYLKTRKLTDETIEKFKLGYALESWDAFLNHAKQKSLTEADLEKSGLIVKSERGGYYDRFRDRLVFSIFNIALKPIAFGARTFKAADDAKYINSPDTPLYHKATVLYGLSHSRGEIRRKEEAIVVEGYFDYLSLYQAGVQHVVASSGTAFTPDQAQLLARCTPSVILMFDSDSAGQAAALRSVDYLFEAGLEVKVVSLPKGDDPDSLARKGGRAAIENQLEKASSYVDFSLSLLPDRWEKLSLGIKDRTIKRLTALAGKIEDPVRRELFLQEVARGCDIDLKLLKRGGQPTAAKPREEQVITRVSRLEEELISLLLSRPDLVEAAVDRIAPIDFEDSQLADYYSLMALLHEEQQAISASALIDKIETVAGRERLAALAARDFDEADLTVMFNDLMQAFAKRQLDRRISQFKKLLQEAESENDRERVNFYLSEIQRLKAE